MTGRKRLLPAGPDRLSPAGTVGPMSRVVRSRVPAVVIPLVLLLTLLCLWWGALLAGSASAQESDPAEAPAVEAPEPAIPVPEDTPDETDPEWSYRFLVPATLLLGTVAVVGAIIMYFVRVTKNRYRVVR